MGPGTTHLASWEMRYGHNLQPSGNSPEARKNDQSIYCRPNGAQFENPGLCPGVFYRTPFVVVVCIAAAVGVEQHDGPRSEWLPAGLPKLATKGNDWLNLVSSPSSAPNLAVVNFLPPNPPIVDGRACSCFLLLGRKGERQPSVAHQGAGPIAQVVGLAPIAGACSCS